MALTFLTARPLDLWEPLAKPGWTNRNRELTHGTDAPDVGLRAVHQAAEHDLGWLWDWDLSGHLSSVRAIYIASWANFGDSRSRQLSWVLLRLPFDLRGCPPLDFVFALKAHLPCLSSFLKRVI
jgi:hypothetical protein